MPSLDPHDRLAELLSTLCDGTLSDAEHAELEERLARDPQAQAIYLRYCRLHADLRLGARSRRAVEAARAVIDGQVAKSPEANQSPRGSVALVRSVVYFFGQPTPVSYIVAALVIGVLVTTMAFMVPPFLRSVGVRDREVARAEVTFVAEVSGLHEAKWAPGQIGALRGAQLVIGRTLDLHEGFAEVTYRNGARVLLEGPTRYCVVGENSGSLDVGRLAAVVPPAASGFTVATPQGEIVDVGTEFGTLVAPTGEIQVVVYQGTVLARPRNGEQQGGTVKLSAGEKVEIKDGVIIKKTETPAPNIQRTLPPPIPAETLVKFEPVEFLLPDGSNLRTTGKLELAWNLAGEASCVVHGVEFKTQNELPEEGVQAEIVGRFVTVPQANAAEPNLVDELRPLMNGCIGTDPTGRRSIQLKLTGLTPGTTYRVQLLCGQAVGNKLRSMHIASGRATTPVFDVDRRSMTVIAQCQAGKTGEAVLEIHSERDRAVLNGVTVFSVPSK